MYFAACEKHSRCRSTVWLPAQGSSMKLEVRDKNFRLLKNLLPPFTLLCIYLHGSHRNKTQGLKETQNNIYTKILVPWKLNIQTCMGFPTMHLQTMRHMKREDEMLWSSDSIERHYTYSRKKRLPRYQAKIWSSCCNLLNWQDRCRRCSSYTAPLAFKCTELQPLSLPGTSQGTSLARNKQYLSAVCGLQAASIHLFFSPVTWITDDSCLGLLSFVWIWTIWWNTKCCLLYSPRNFSVAERTDNYQNRNKQINIMMDLFLVDSIRPSWQ